MFCPFRAVLRFKIHPLSIRHRYSAGREPIACGGLVDERGIASESAAKMIIQMITIKITIFSVYSLLCMLTEDVRGASDVWDSAENNLDYKSSKNTKTKMSKRMNVSAKHKYQDNLISMDC